MSYIIPDRVEISIIFNDMNYPLNQFNVLNFLHIGSSIRMLVPTLKISVTDQSGMLGSGVLVDGCSITVVLQSLGDGRSSTYKFHLSNFTSNNTPVGSQYTIYGYGYPPKYFGGTTTEGIRGTSDYVLSQIAQACQLTYDGTTTNDAQLWMPQNRSYAVFALRTAEYGYADEQSLMKLAFCPEGILRYKNLNKISDITLKCAQGKSDGDRFIIVDHRPSTSNGTSNLISGYNLARRRQGDTNPQQEIYDQLQFTSDSKTPLIDVTTKEQIGRGLQSFTPIDFGNTNENYDRGFYQNRRYSALLSMGTDFLTTYVSSLLLLDKIDFSAEDANGNLDTTTSGQYIITSKAIVAQGPNYYEKFEGVKNGTNWSK